MCFLTKAQSTLYSQSINMGYKCDECESTFHEKKNLQQHMRKERGLKKYKCDHCNFHSDDLSHVRTHEKSLHKNEIFKCEQCE